MVPGWRIHCDQDVSFEHPSRIRQRMRRWFLSYNSRDLDLVERLETALRRKDPEAKIFFAPSALRAGGYWLPQLADAIGESTVFVLLVGERGLGPWQVDEYYEARDVPAASALDRHA
jgi:hypothetical protein